MTTAIAHKPANSTAVARTNGDKLRGLLNGDQFKEAVRQVLPTHLKPDRFVRVALMAMTKTPLLNECDQASFFQGLLLLSQLGIEPDGRRAHLIPFKNNKKGIYEVQVIVDYKGLVELITNTGLVSKIHADVVCENDIFEWDTGEVKKHVIDWKEPRGQVYAAYAVVTFKDGSSKADCMSVEDIEAIRRRSRASTSGPWVTDWNEMAKKTVFRRCSKWVKLSPEQREAVEADDTQFDDHRFNPAKVITEAKGIFGTAKDLPPAVTPALMSTEDPLDEVPMDYPEPNEEPAPAPAPAPKAKKEAPVSPLITLRSLLTKDDISEAEVIEMCLRKFSGKGVQQISDYPSEYLETVLKNWDVIVAQTRFDRAGNANNV